MRLMDKDCENFGIHEDEYHSIVVHCFECNDIIHVNGKVDPTSDIHVIILELIF